MANHSPSHEPRGYADHKDTYDGFLTGSIAMSIVCGFVLVALCAFRFMDNWNVFVGFVGIIVGIIATLFEVRTGGTWKIAGGLLVLYGLFVAINL